MAAFAEAGVSVTCPPVAASMASGKAAKQLSAPVALFTTQCRAEVPEAVSSGAAA